MSNYSSWLNKHASWSGGDEVTEPVSDTSISISSLTKNYNLLSTGSIYSKSSDFVFTLTTSAEPLDSIEYTLDGENWMVAEASPSGTSHLVEIRLSVGEYNLTFRLAENGNQTESKFCIISRFVFFRSINIFHALGSALRKRRTEITLPLPLPPPLPWPPSCASACGSYACRPGPPQSARAASGARPPPTWA